MRAYPLFVAFFILLVLSGCGTPSPTPQNEALSRLVKGYEYYQAGQFSEASAEFNNAIELDPALADAYLGRGHTYNGLEQWEKAIKDFDRAIELDSSMPAAVYVSRGSAYSGLEQWEKAIENFDHAIELTSKTSPDQAILILAYKGRAHANVALFNNEQAHQDFETVLTLDPNDPEADDIKKILELLKPPSTQKQPSSLCFWFAESQVLRAARISGLTKFMSFFQTRGVEDLASLDQADLDELIEILEEYLPYERDFINKWEELGSVPGGEVFWEKELETEKQKLSAFEKMLDGAKDVDDTLFLDGRDELVQAIQIGRESEAAMREIYDKCVDELK